MLRHDGCEGVAKYTTEAIVSDGLDKGELRKVCTEAKCPVHHPRKRPQQIANDAKWKIDVDAIGLKVKHEFAAREKSNLTQKAATKAALAKVRKSA